MEIQVELSEPEMELLLLRAAVQEIPAEEIVVRAIQNDMKRGNDNAD